MSTALIVIDVQESFRQQPAWADISDPHIAERNQLTLASLAPATYRAFAAATATVIRTLQNLEK